MYLDVQTVTGGAFETSLQVKTETIDFEPDHSDSDGFQCFDEVEIGPEFKTEPIVEKISEDCSKLFGSHDFQYLDKIVIEKDKEIKTEPSETLIPEKTLEDDAKIFDLDGSRCCDEIEIGKEFKAEHSIIKNSFDDDSKPLDSSSFQCFDEIEVGDEFKIEPVPIQKSPDDPSKISNFDVSQCIDEVGKKLKTKSSKDEKTTADNSELVDTRGFQSFDEIENGVEFQAEPFTVGETPNDNAKSSDEKLKLAYCKKCNEARPLGEKNRSKCVACESTLVYKCGNCMKVHSSIKSLSTHLKSHRKRKTRLSCDHCDWKFSRKREILRHIKSKHSPSPNKCKRCGKQYSSLQGFRKHVVSCRFRSESRHFRCEHCDYHTHRKDALVLHIHAKHFPSAPNVCDRCGKSFTYAKGLQGHQKSCGRLAKGSSKSKRFQCDDCQYSSTSRSNLVRHMQVKHLPKNQRLKHTCGLCGKSYVKLAAFKIHSTICGHPERLAEFNKFSCAHCAYKCELKEKLAGHIQAKHSSSNLYKCLKCAKSFAYSSGLRTHRRICGIPKNPKPTPEAEKRFCCDHCGYRCKYKQLLAVHVQREHTKDTFECKICGKEFNCQRSLYRHNTYTCTNKRKLLSCAHCDHKTPLKSNLVNHIRAKHLARKLYSSKCKKCGKIYSNSSSLWHHARTCGKEKSYKPKCSLQKMKARRYACDHCIYKSDRKYVLASHIHTQHMKC